MKRRETKGGYEDRLSGMMPDPSRLSAVSRSPLVRAGARWASFARGLSRGHRRRTAAADTLGFIESLYGSRFESAEGGASPPEKVYRTAGGRRFVSETRLSVSFHPRFDLRLLSVARSQSFGEEPAPPARTGVSQRLRQSVAWHITNSTAAAPSLKVQTWGVLRAGAERHLPAFGYVTVYGQRAQQWHEPARHSARGDVARVASVGTSRRNAAQAPASLRLTSLDLLRPVINATRQEFVNVLLNTYLPAAVSGELLSMGTAGALLGASPGKATAQGGAGRRPGTWTYREPAPLQAPGGAGEARREYRQVETAHVHGATRVVLTPLSHVLSRAALLSGMPSTSTTVPAGKAGHPSYHLGGRAQAPSLQLLRTHTASPGTRGGSPPGTLDRTPPRQSTGTRGVLTSLRTFVERAHATVAGITLAGGSPFFTRPGFGRVSARQRGAPSVRPASVAEFDRYVSTPDAGTKTATGFFSTRGAPAAGTFLFATGLPRRPTGTASADAPPSPTAATALRLATAAGAEREVREARAARPEGMALDLIRHRREQVLRLPPPGYVFTQPQRTQLEERQVITKASREEIVEVVRKEVRALAASAPAAPAPPRAELAGLADEVYSTLVRRLLVEKERLGRF